jgi:hypothetical protein
MYFYDATDRAYNRHGDLTMFVSGHSRKYLSQKVGFQAMHRGEEGIDFL